MSKDEKNTTTTANADALLEKVSGMFAEVVVCGIDNKGIVSVQTSVPNATFCHMMLNRSLFEVNLFEKQESDKVASASSEELPPELTEEDMKVDVQEI